MTDAHADLLLLPHLLSDGSAWYIEVTWPNGRVERIGDFGSETTARDWIAWESDSYFAVQHTD